MAPNGVVFQLVALVQWRARAQAHYACTQLPSVSHTVTGSGGWARLTQSDSESESAGQIHGQTVSDTILNLMLQACNYLVANLGYKTVYVPPVMGRWS